MNPGNSPDDPVNPVLDSWLPLFLGDCIGSEFSIARSVPKVVIEL
jgi:hypothetical protein